MWQSLSYLFVRMKIINEPLLFQVVLNLSVLHRTSPWKNWNGGWLITFIYKTPEKLTLRPKPTSENAVFPRETALFIQIYISFLII